MRGPGDRAAPPPGQARAREGATRDEWFAGWASALSAIWRLHHDAQMIRHIMVASGITVRSLELARVDHRDLAVIRRAFFGEEDPA